MPAVDHTSQLASLPIDQPIIMGILNTTPDSFSDGGSWGTVDRAVRHGELMIAQGARLVDVGGESTRPGAEPVSVHEEIERVLPVIQQLAGQCVISIDTTKPEVAAAAIEAGASIVNDVSSSLAAVAGEYGVGWVAMHMQGKPQTMQENPTYSDVVDEVLASLRSSVEAAKNAGVESVWVDPGIGFGKTTQHNLALLQHISALAEVAPVVVGVSRKRLIGEIHFAADERLGEAENVGANDRLEGSVTAAVWSWSCGANIVRTHDVKETVQAARFLRNSKRI